MKTRTIALALLVAIAPATVSLPAFAQDEATTQAARARFKEGVEYYDKGQYENARAAFLQAYALKKHPDVLFNLAQSSLKSGHPLEAEKSFQQFLRESRNVTPAKRTEAEKGIADARAKLGRIDVSAPSGTEISLDGERVGVAPLTEPLVMEGGSHIVSAKFSDGSTDSQTFNVTSGQQTSARFTKQAPPPVVAPVPVPPTTTTIPPPASSTVESTAEPVDTAPEETTAHKTWIPKNMTPVYVGGAITVVSAAVAITWGIVLKGQAQKKLDDVRNQIQTKAGDRARGICVSQDPADIEVYGRACQTYKDDVDAVNADATIGNVGTVLAVTAGAGTILYWIFSTKRTSSDGPTSASVQSAPSFTVVPSYTPQFKGFSLTGQF